MIEVACCIAGRRPARGDEVDEFINICSSDRAMSCMRCIAESPLNTN